MKKVKLKKKITKIKTDLEKRKVWKILLKQNIKEFSTVEKNVHFKG